MALPVSLREFVNEMDMFGDGSVFLHRRTGELLATTEDDLRAADDEEDIDVPEWQQDIIPKIREAMNSEDWLSLPSKFDIDEYRIMRDFAHTVSDGTLREDLLDTIGGSGTFGRFKSMVHRHNLLDRWYQFRESALRKIAVGWLEANDIPYCE